MADTKSWGGGVPDEAPDYVIHRLEVWDRVREAQMEAAAKEAGTEPVLIEVTLPDNRKVQATAGVSTPAMIARELPGDVWKSAIVAVVNGGNWDMNRPLRENCTLKICGFDTDEGKEVLWHSTAHMLGEAMEYKYKGELCIGPPLKNEGFYYDIHLGGGRTVSEDEFKDLESRVEKIAKSKRSFERMELTKDDARSMFAFNPFKLEIINELKDGDTITAYRDGPFIDLCRGPHVANSASVKGIMIRKTGSAYWRAKVENASLQRVYGISFPDKASMVEYKKFLKEAAERDHRLIGRNQELYFFNALSPGSAFFLTHGARIYNTLMSFLRDEYWKRIARTLSARSLIVPNSRNQQHFPDRSNSYLHAVLWGGFGGPCWCRHRGYQEVMSPNVFDFQLWEISGHAANYRENMFSFESEKREFGLKPMNCPGHCVIYGSRVRSYRELPLRMAEFGVLHRNELSGTLSGLTRVRKFVQDDAHIFCTPNQVKDEIVAYLDFMKFVYDIFGFKFHLELSTRPEHYLGEISMWDSAEKELADALLAFTGSECGEGWQLDPGDGAFYGPKIDIKVTDALGRSHQCATVQLDFQLPIRFDLWYKAPRTDPSPRVEEAADGVEQTSTNARGNDVTEKGDMKRPVIIHRAIYGSFERFIGIITEHFAGKWPLWLSPRQVIIVPVSDNYLAYAYDVQKSLLEGKFFVDVDATDRKLNKKVREAQLAQYNFILVVGEKEAGEGTVNVRTRENAVQGTKTVMEFRNDLEEMRRNHQ